jgi:hypothetical protein
MKKKIVLEINIDFGSKFQKATILDSLALLLKAWKTFYESAHKKNRIKFNLKEE